MAEIASKFNIHPGQVHNWKAEIMGKLPHLFEDISSSNKCGENLEQHIFQLERKVGQLTIENDFLKKNWEGYALKKGKK